LLRPIIGGRQYLPQLRPAELGGDLAHRAARRNDEDDRIDRADREQGQCRGPVAVSCKSLDENRQDFA
jgi:hypothetical protein